MKNKQIRTSILNKTITVKAIPGSSKKGIISQEDGVFKIGLNSPPHGGKANEELIEFLSDYFDVRKKDISIIKGVNCREKTILIKEK